MQSIAHARCPGSARLTRLLPSVAACFGAASGWCSVFGRRLPTHKGATFMPVPQRQFEFTLHFGVIPPSSASMTSKTELNFEGSKCW
jgi:hypothetical protein